MAPSNKTPPPRSTPFTSKVLLASSP
jgi:hypothetical protein